MMINASDEVIAHHIAHHPCWNSEHHPYYVAVCPCGATKAMICADCQEPVIGALLLDAPPCEHAVGIGVNG